MTLLDIRGLSKRFGGVRALHEVDVAMDEGEAVALIGPNGSGKTTLFNVVSGFLDSDAGTVSWRGEDITAMGAHRRARRGLVRTFQETMVFPRLDVLENLDTALNASRSPEWNAHELGKYIGLGAVLSTDARDLSWGQTRLLGIALALAIGPRLLLLDEPFAGLSPAAASAVNTAIRRLHDDGIALCVVDHEMSYLMPLVERVVVLDSGHKIAEGHPDEVVEDPLVREAYLGTGT